MKLDILVNTHVVFHNNIFNAHRKATKLQEPVEQTSQARKQPSCRVTTIELKKI